MSTKHTLVMRHDKDGNVRPKAMAAHTPGPWMESSFEVWSPLNGKRFGKVVADLRRADGTSDEAKANARLIAAAPELLEALKTIANGTVMEVMGERSFTMADVVVAYQKIAYKAIAKATNETL